MMIRVFLCIAVVSALGGSAEAGEAKTTFLLIGKDRDHPPQSHEYMSECELLAKCLRQTPGVEAVVSNGWPSDPKLLESVDAIVLYTAMGGNVLAAPQRRAQVEALLARGVGLVAIHWSTGADDGLNGVWWLDHLGGWFAFSFSKFLVRDSRVRQVHREHPICRGWSDFDFRDEYYIGLKFHPDAQPLLVASIDGQEQTIGWTYERPGGAQPGRSFGFVCGHFHECFANDSFRRSVVNAALWAAHLEVPAAGAPCDINAADLVLPPDPRTAPK
jgi:type 1 glutamine amidotransferase